ncbi:MAG TPA: hypothetical protein VL382_00245, partial [Terriglobales bacterium]|nr:hypothetical protein [Terriglobales bacterium]
GISDIITIPGIINRDFADVKAIMAGMGPAVMGTATAKGENRATLAAQSAIASPLLEAGAIDGARGILINITGSSSLKLSEVHEASTIIQSAAHEDANIIFGAVMDEKMKDEVKITVIATGFQTEKLHRSEKAVSAAATAIAQQRTMGVYTQPNPAPQVTRPSIPVAPRTPMQTPGRETPNLQNVKDAVKDVEHDDLDVPAFIRKRGDSQ